MNAGKPPGDKLPSMIPPSTYAPGEVQEAARASRTDAQLIEQFVRERGARSRDTQASYLCNLRRLGWFCRLAGLPSVRHLQREHWSAFREYLRQPPAEHIMARSVGYDDPSWAPFRKPLIESSANTAETICRSFYAWMADAAVGAIDVNPVGSVRMHAARRSATVAGVDRFLTESEQQYVQRAIECMPVQRPEQLRMRLRADWVVFLALRTGLRAAEIARGRSDMIRAGAKAGTYSLHIVRKGGVQSQLPLLPEVVARYRLYLRSMGLPSDDLRRLSAPLVLPARRRLRADQPVPASSRTHIWRIFKDATLIASDLALEDGQPDVADRLRHASTHWMRHSFATMLLDAGADLRSARDLLDHATIKTSSIYAHRPEQRLREDLDRLDAHLKTRQVCAEPPG